MCDKLNKMKFLSEVWTIMKKGKGFVNEFKKFIMRGNVMDMAVGVIVGGAFTAIVTSLNQDILTPILGLFGGTDFSNLFIQLTGSIKYDTLAAAQEAGVATLAYGKFITAVINFLITALVIFCLIKGINAISERFSKKEEEPVKAPATKPPKVTTSSQSVRYSTRKKITLKVSHMVAQL